MSKKNLLIILVVILVVILIGIGIFLSQNKQEPTGETEGVMEKIEIGEEGWSGKLKEALSLGQSLRCEWSLGEMSSMYYVKGDKFYTETAMPEGTTYMINDGECSYVWKNGDATGTKFCEADLPEVSVEEENAVEDFGYSNEQLDYEVDCQTVIVNDLIFVPPVNIEFVNPFETLNLGDLDLGM